MTKIKEMKYKVLKTRNVDLFDMSIQTFEDNFNDNRIPVDGKADMLKQVIETLEGEYDGDQ